MSPNFDGSSSVHLFNRTELYLGGTIGGKTGIALVLRPLVLNSVAGNPSGLHMFLFISNHFHSHINVSIYCLFPEASSV